MKIFCVLRIQSFQQAGMRTCKIGVLIENLTFLGAFFKNRINCSE
jgi:hypothetical protein